MSGCFREARGGRCVAADVFRRDEDVHFVDRAHVEQRVQAAGRRLRPARSSCGGGRVRSSSDSNRSACDWPVAAEDFDAGVGQASHGVVGRRSGRNRHQHGTSRAVFTSWLSGESDAMRIDHDAHGRPLHVGRVRRPGGQQRIVDPRGAAADDDRVHAAAKLLHDLARRARSKSSGCRRPSPACRRASWPTWRSPTAGRSSSRLRYGALSSRASFGEQADLALDAGRAQLVESAAVDRRERILHGDHDPASRRRRSGPCVQGGVLPWWQQGSSVT